MAQVRVNKKCYNRRKVSALNQLNYKNMIKGNFIGAAIYNDFEEGDKKKSLFIQYLVKKK